MAKCRRGDNSFRALRCVPIAENRSQGGQIGHWVKKYGVRRGDYFDVFAEYDPHAPNPPFYCTSGFAGATNPDASNFIFYNGRFVDAPFNGRVQEAPLYRNYLLKNGHIAMVPGAGPWNATNAWTDDEQPIEIEREVSQEEVQQMVATAEAKRAAEAKAAAEAKTAGEVKLLSDRL